MTGKGHDTPVRRKIREGRTQRPTHGSANETGGVVSRQFFQTATHPSLCEVPILDPALNFTRNMIVNKHHAEFTIVQARNHVVIHTAIFEKDVPVFDAEFK
jgi:hypothetical protein